MPGPSRTPSSRSSAAPKPAPAFNPRPGADPKSPFFARIAAGYLGEGRTREALSLCEEGTQVFPRYATGSLILGRCYEALGRYEEASVEYRRVLRSLPENGHVRKLVDHVDELERMAYEVFTAALEQELAPQKESVAFEEFATGRPAAPPSTVELLIKQLQQAPKMPRGNITPVASVVQDEQVQEPAPTIVTETLAEIYASQGQYGEAIQAYKTLSAGKPQDAARFAERIVQLEELIKLQGEEEKDA